MSTLGERIKLVIGELSQAKFGESIGVTAQAVNQWVNGKAKPNLENLVDIATKYETDLNWLMRPDIDIESGAQKSPETSSTPIQNHVYVEPAFTARDLPVYAAVEGGDGDLVVSIEPIDVVQRPWYLGEVRDGYAVIVTGESMVPAYEPGDMAIVNPRLSYMRGKVHIFTAESENTHFRATIKKLVAVTDTHWKVEQYNPPATLMLPRNVWTKAKRVVGKLND